MAQNFAIDGVWGDDWKTSQFAQKASSESERIIVDMAKQLVGLKRSLGREYPDIYSRWSNAGLMDVERILDGLLSQVQREGP
jgi:hypothetical protein